MTWTATERELRTLEQGLADEAPILLTEIRDDQTNLICQLHAPADDPAAIEEMRARARLIVKAEKMRDLLKRMLGGFVAGSRLDDEARAIIAATEYDTVDRADLGHRE